MSTKREREFIDRIDRVVKECSILYPANPAHTAAVLGHAPVIHHCLKDVTAAIGNWRMQDWRDADERLTRAENRLAEHRSWEPREDREMRLEREAARR